MNRFGSSSGPSAHRLTGSPIGSPVVSRKCAELNLPWPGGTLEEVSAEQPHSSPPSNPSVRPLTDWEIDQSNWPALPKLPHVDISMPHGWAVVDGQAMATGGADGQGP